MGLYCIALIIKEMCNAFLYDLKDYGWQNPLNKI